VYTDAADGTVDGKITVMNLSSDGTTVTLYATWVPTQYTVTFAAGDHGSMSGYTGPYSVAYGDVLDGSLVPSTSLAAGYKFSHWAYVMTVDGTPVKVDITQDPTHVHVWGNTVFTAVWLSTSTYLVRYSPGDHGAFGEVENVTYWTGVASGASMSDYPFPGNTDTSIYIDTIDTNPRNFGNPAADPGWKFLGWKWTVDGVTYATYANSNGWTVSELPTTVTSDLNFSAQWEQSQQVLTFDANGGTALTSNLSARAVTTSDSVVLPDATDVARAGYTLAGWGLSSTGAAAYAPGATATSITGNMTLYAIWEANTYTLVYDTQGGSVIANRTGVGWTQSDLLNGIADPTKPGFSFVGWYVGTSEDS
jgi:uncharacterized repeat protein (TIGR02543 family)